MSGQIKVSSSSAAAEASRVSGAAQYFRGRTLPMQDGTSTISANQNSKDAYEGAQKEGTSIGRALDKDAENIRSLGNAFAEFDTMMGTLNGQGN